MGQGLTISTIMYQVNISYYCWVTEVGTAAMIQVRPSSSESSTVFRSVEITFSGVLRFLRKQTSLSTSLFLFTVNK